MYVCNVHTRTHTHTGKTCVKVIAQSGHCGAHPTIPHARVAPQGLVRIGQGVRVTCNAGFVPRDPEAFLPANMPRCVSTLGSSLVGGGR